MKTNYRLFVGLAVFYAIMTFVYYYVGGEPLGISCLLLSSLLSAMVGYYVWFTDRRIDTTRLRIRANRGSQCNGIIGTNDDTTSSRIGSTGAPPSHGDRIVESSTHRWCTANR